MPRKKVVQTGPKAWSKPLAIGTKVTVQLKATICWPLDKPVGTPRESVSDARFDISGIPCVLVQLESGGQPVLIPTLKITGVVKE